MLGARARRVILVDSGLDVLPMSWGLESGGAHRHPDGGAPAALADGPVADDPHPVAAEVGVVLPKSDRLDGDAVGHE